MKKYLFIMLLSFTATGAFAQTHKLTIYSSFDENYCVVQYSNYDKLYPDSIRAAVMIDYKEKYKLVFPNTLILRMNLDGWKLISVIVKPSGYGGLPESGSIYSTTEYLMSKEILLDDAAMNLYLQNLKNLR
jgi:hypothetical protein